MFFAALRIVIWCCYLTKLQIGVDTAALENFNVIDFFRDVQRLHGFEQILLMVNKNSTIAKEFLSAPNDEQNTGEEKHLGFEIMKGLQIPIVQLNELTTFYLKQKFSERMLTVVNVGSRLDQHNGLLKNLILNLRHMSTSNIIFLINNESVDDSLLTQLFSLCWNLKIINAVAVFADFQVILTLILQVHRGILSNRTYSKIWK